MKKLILFTVFILLAGSISAQQMNRQSSPHIINKYGDVLQLSDEQLSQIAAIQLEYRSEMRPDRTAQVNRQAYRNPEQRMQNRSEQREDRMEERTEMHEQIMAVLIPAQKEALKQERIKQAHQQHAYRNAMSKERIKAAELNRSTTREIERMFKEHNDLVLQTQLNRIASGETGPDASVMQARMELHEQLREKLTVAQYQAMGFQVMGIRAGENQNRARENRPRRMKNQR